MCRRVLVVDDDSGFRRVMRTTLEDAGYTVFEAYSGTSALAQLAVGAQGTVVLLDLLMSGMSGFDVLHVLALDEQLATRHAFIVVTAMDTRTPPMHVLRLHIQLDVSLQRTPAIAHAATWIRVRYLSKPLPDWLGLCFGPAPSPASRAAVHTLWLTAAPGAGGARLGPGHCGRLRRGAAARHGEDHRRCLATDCAGAAYAVAHPTPAGISCSHVILS
jgi:CheY-like chemotaxis protein